MRLSTKISTEAEATQFERALYLNSFYAFAKFFLGYKDLAQKVHGQYVRVFESSAPRKIMVMPRGTFKSTLGSIAYPIWRLLKDPNLTVLIDSEIYTNSKNFLRSIKGHFESPEMVRIFGSQIGRKWDESEIIINSRTDNTIKEASITVGGIDTVKVGQHFSLIIMDDMNSPRNSETPEKCQKVIDHLRYILSILNPGGELIVIGTRYSERDLIGFLLGEVLGEKHMAEGKMQRYIPSDETDNVDEGILLLGGR